MSDIRMAAQGGPGFGNDVFDRLLSERIIFLGSQVDDEIANKLCAQILLLSAEDPTRDISCTLTPQVAPSPQAWQFMTP